MNTNMLNQAIAMIRAGERDAARKLLILYVQEYPKNEMAWLWLVETLPSAQQRVAALENCLTHNPQSILARRGLQLLRDRLYRTGMLSSTFPTRPLMPEELESPPGGPATPNLGEPPRTQPQAWPDSSGQVISPSVFQKTPSSFPISTDEKLSQGVEPSSPTSAVPQSPEELQSGQPAVHPGMEEAQPAQPPDEIPVKISASPELAGEALQPQEGPPRTPEEILGSSILERISSLQHRFGESLAASQGITEPAATIPEPVKEQAATSARAETARPSTAAQEEIPAPRSFPERVSEALRRDILPGQESTPAAIQVLRKKATRRRLALAILFGLIALLVLLVGFYFYTRWKMAQGGSPQAITITVTASTTPSAQPTPSMTREDQANLAFGSSWVQMPPMSYRRTGMAVTLMDNGQVLVTGGIGAVQEEIYSPVSDRWRSIAPMNDQRTLHQAALLQDGRILVVGGIDPKGKPVIDAELFDPSLEIWTRTNPPSQVHGEGLTLTQLPDGRILAVGGVDHTSQSPRYAGAEIYDPFSGTWTETAAMITPRAWHTAVLLKDGRVLVCGGENQAPLKSAEIYDPATGIWTSTGEMAEERQFHTTTLLTDGQVLAVGGGRNEDEVSNTAELYDPTTGKWSSAGSMRALRMKHIAARLPDGRVLIAGGSLDWQEDRVSNSAEFYDPALRTWNAAPPMMIPHADHAAVLLEDGRLMVVGGTDGKGNAYSEVEGFGPEKAFASPSGEQELTPTPANLEPLETPQSGTSLLYAFPGPPEARDEPPYAPPAFSPDGKVLALEGKDGELVLWDTQSGKALQSLKSGTFHKEVVFSPDGSRVATSTYGPLFVLDSATGLTLFTFEINDAVKTRPLRDMLGLSFSPDGRYLMLGLCYGVEVCEGSDEDEVRIWDMTNGKLVYTLPKASLAVFNPLGAVIAAAQVNAADEPIQLFAADTGQQLKVLESLPDAAPPTVIAFSPAGSFLAANSGAENGIGLWRTNTGQLLHELKGFPQPVDELLFSPQGQYLIAASRHGVAWVWNFESGEKIAAFDRESRVATGLFTEDGKALLARTSGADNSAVELWDVIGDQKLKVLEGRSGPVQYLLFSPDGNRLVTMSLDWIASLWDLEK